jgi:FkbM family methyltransferase
MLDVGANTGQFARALRGAGYAGSIISFEPLSDAHARLTLSSQDDPLWTIAARTALASQKGEAQINVARNSQSSSMLRMLERHIAADPTSAYVRQETVPVTTLDSFIDSMPTLADSAFGLKVDTQGYEAEVLKGLKKWSHKVEVIMAELSLSTLYEGEARFVDLYRTIEERGYRCISIEPGFTNTQTYEVLQVDTIFER